METFFSSEITPKKGVDFSEPNLLARDVEGIGLYSSLNCFILHQDLDLRSRIKTLIYILPHVFIYIKKIKGCLPRHSASWIHNVFSFYFLSFNFLNIDFFNFIIQHYIPRYSVP
jgi:hypothetical protein